MADRERPRDAADGGGALSVGLLGPLEVSAGGRPIGLTTGRLRSLLAVLAMSAGEAVSLDRLAAAVWEDDLPGNARRAVQTYVTRLRGALGAGLIATTSTGYVLRVEPEQVDALRFERLLDAAAAAPDRQVEQELLAEALALWRGQPFDGVWSPWLEDTEAPRLVERYLAAVERQVDLDVADGRHADLATLLRGLVARHPLRESLWVRLLVVLHRCGRPAEALEGYETIRVRLAEELGTDPGRDLQRVYADLLAGRAPTLGDGDGDGDGPAAVRAAAPQQLPASTDGFTGRADALVVLDGLLGGALAGAGGPIQPAPAICVIAGAAGVGKTTLAIQAAHRLADRFPDGQLYVNLHGATAGLSPLEPLEVLGRFLRALGMEPAGIPTDIEEAGAAFRSRVADRRLLMVLDDAADTAQVAPLLPAGPGCGVLVTSRRTLVSLNGARHLYLDVMPAEEAVELLGRLVGQERVAAEPAHAAEVARLCGYLPLAVRIAGARLAARPGWPMRVLADRLADERRRLDELELAEAGVRASYAVSFQQLRSSADPADRAAAGAFGLLGVLDGPDVGVPAVARLLGRSEDAVERVLERLVDAQLLETPAPGRYRLHDLLRLYARELAREHEPEAVRAAALTSALGFYVGTAWNALTLLRPGDYRLTLADDRWRKDGVEFADDTAALRWLEAERANLLTAVQQAATTPGVPAELANQLAHALFGFFVVRSHWKDAVQAYRTALEVAGRAGDRAAQAKALNDLGVAYWRLGRYAEALACQQQSLAISRELGDRQSEGASLNNLGLVYYRQGRYEQALASYRKSLAIDRELGDRHGEGASLNNLGNIYYEQGRYEQALASYRKSLAIDRELGDRHGQACSLESLSKGYMALGRYEEALACHQEAVGISRALGDRYSQATGLNELGLVYQRQQHYEQALACHQESLKIFQELGDPSGQAESLRELGVTHRALGCQRQAAAHWRQALALFEQLQSTKAGEVRALLAEQPASPAR